jgi:hypothetical protein
MGANIALVFVCADSLLGFAAAIFLFDYHETM